LATGPNQCIQELRPRHQDPAEHKSSGPGIGNPFEGKYTIVNTAGYIAGCGLKQLVFDLIGFGAAPCKPNPTVIKQMEIKLLIVS